MICNHTIGLGISEKSSVVPITMLDIAYAPSLPSEISLYKYCPDCGEQLPTEIHIVKAVETLQKFEKEVTPIIENSPLSVACKRKVEMWMFRLTESREVKKVHAELAAKALLGILIYAKEEGICISEELKKLLIMDKSKNQE